jgi:hypothetical protein
MTATQPLVATRRPALPTSRQTELIRLLTQWADLARRAIEAFVHDEPGWASLQASQLRTEEALERRFPWEWAVLGDALILWESTLLHAAGGEPHPLCSHCRRAELGLVPSLPLPALGGVR